MSAASSTDSLDAWLELPGGNLHWLGPRCTIGRDPENDLVLQADAVSRRHALVAGTPGAMLLTDLHSRNGTYVNGRMLNRPHALRDGDRIRIGDLEIGFRCRSTHESRGPDTLDLTPAATRVVENVTPRSCWLLLLDIEGYSSLSAELGSANALRRVQAWIALLRPVIEQGGGTINRYLGDAIFAYWLCDGTPPARFETALLDCVALRASSPVPYRVVAHQGVAVFTRSSNGEELGGQEVNFLFRAEKIAKNFATGVLLSAPLVRSLGLEQSSPRLGTSAVDGIPGEFEFYGSPAASGPGEK